MRWHVLCAALMTACSVEDVDWERTEVVITPVSPPVPGGGEPVHVFRGNLIITSASISTDGGVTWSRTNPQIVTSTAQVASDDVLYVNTTAFGLGRWTLSDGMVRQLTPPLARPSAFHVRRTGTLLLAEGNGQPLIARQANLMGGAWQTAMLPLPPNPGIVGINSFASSATVTLAATSHGVFRTLDDGLSWTHVHTPTNISATYVVALQDGRFLLRYPNLTTDILDTMGMPTGARGAAWPSTDLARSCLGGLIVDGKISRDLGTTWQPVFPSLVAGGYMTTTVACDANGNALAHVTGPQNTFLFRLDPSGVPGDIVPFGTTATPLAGDFLLAADGTVLVRGLAWKPGDATWSLRFLPEGTVHTLDDGSLLAVSATTMQRSRDAGRTWMSTAITGTAPAATRYFSDGQTLWASAGTQSSGSFRAQLWRSDDEGATWMEAFDRTSTQPDATDTNVVAPQLVAIARDGTFVGTSHYQALHVSRDRGRTWESLPFPRDYDLEFVTNGGAAVTLDMVPHPAWTLWHDYGLGRAFREVTVKLDNGAIADIRATPPKLDGDDHVYLLGGGAIYRTDQPLH